MPGDQSVAENATLQFDSARPISVADAVAGTNLLQLSLSVTNGTLTLVSTNGLVWVEGSNDSDEFTVAGSLTDLNGAFSGVIYAGAKNFYGADSLVVNVDDLGACGAGGDLTASNSVSIV